MNITIVGGGISGLSLAYFLLEKAPSLQIRILEASDRPGGKIWSDKADGFLCESGVNGFLDNKPLSLELAEKLSLTSLRSNDAARKRFIYSNGRLHQLPESPQAFLFSKLLTPWGRGRVFYEFFARRGKDNDESLSSFAKRRLGVEAYNKLIDPMASGIYAGDPEKLSLKSCFPRIYELEKRYGSLLRAMIILQFEALLTGRKIGPGPGGILTSFHGGMETVINSLKDALGDRLVTSSRVKGIGKYGKGYQVFLENGNVIESEEVVIGCPAYEAAKILNDFDTRLSKQLARIPYPSVSVVCMGFRRRKIRYNLDGFGFLIPWTEGRKILGTLWDSSIFPGRAPRGYVLLRTMVGGARASDLAMQDDESLLDLIGSELREIMNIKSSPDFVRIYRHEKAIPQYNVGHSARLERIDKYMKKHKGLYLTGNSYRGIGFNDCIENSYKLAERIVNEHVR